MTAKQQQLCQWLRRALHALREAEKIADETQFAAGEIGAMEDCADILYRVVRKVEDSPGKMAG